MTTRGLAPPARLCLVDAARCAFCGDAPNRETAPVARVVVAPRPGAAICANCLALCNEILDQQDATREQLSRRLTPRQIRAELDRWVVGQSRAKKVLAVATHLHVKRRVLRARRGSGVEVQKSNVLLVGPTGTGKTLLASTLARVLDVPFVVADATTLTDAGYVGEDVQSVLQKLLAVAGNDVAKAREGVVFIDEVDKIARRASASTAVHDVSGEAVQQGLLKMIEGASVSVPARRVGRGSQAEMVTIDTRDILFIAGGAFVGLDAMIRARTGRSGIGFGAELSPAAAGEGGGAVPLEPMPEDLICFGMIPEFVGRFPVVVSLEALDEAALLAVLNEPRGAPLAQFQALLRMEGCELEFTPAAQQALVGRALRRGDGARGLRSLLESVLLDVMFELPAMDGVRKVVVDADAVVGRGLPRYDFEEPPLAPPAAAGA